MAVEGLGMITTPIEAPLVTGEELLAMGRRDQMEHLVHHDVFEQVLRLLDQLGVQPDVSRPVIAASPLGLHPSDCPAGRLNA